MRIGLNISLDLEHIKTGNTGAHGLISIAAYLEKYLPEIEFFLSYDIKSLIEYKPDILAISSCTETFNKTIYTATTIKQELNIPVIVGGHHITELPQSLPDSIDIGVIGEGEKTFLNIIKYFLNKIDKLEKIKGIVFHKDKSLIINEKQDFISNIDEIPLPKRELLKNNFKQSLFTSRGCPFHCIYCTASKFWGKVRFHSPERVLKEIEQILNICPEQSLIHIHDDLFTINLPRLKKISELIRAENLHKRVSFTCNVRANTFNEEICELLLKMNVEGVFIGFESASDRILNYLKGSVKNKQNLETLKICKKYKLRVYGSFIVGSPIETKSEIAKTYWFIRANSNFLERINICHATVLPGNKFWEYAKKKKLINDNFKNWHNLHLNFVKGESIFLNENCSLDEFNEIYGEFVKIQKQNWNTYFENLKERIIHKEYLKKTYNKVVEIIEKLKYKNILEIKEYPEESILSFYDSNDVVSINDWKYLENIELKKFDLIFCSYNIENSYNPIEKLRFFLDKKILFSFYNTLNTSFLMKLLSNNWVFTHYWIPQKYQCNFFTLFSFTKYLKKYGFKIKIIERVEYSCHVQSKIMDILLKKLNLSEEIIKEINIFSYIVLANN